MELQDQLYLITGILSGAILLILAFVTVLAMQLKKEKRERIKNEARFLTSADPHIHRGEELQRRGYGMYGGHDNHGLHHDPHGKHHKSHVEPHHHGGEAHHGSIPSLHTASYQHIQHAPLQHGGVRSSKNYRH